MVEIMKCIRNFAFATKISSKLAGYFGIVAVSIKRLSEDYFGYAFRLLFNRNDNQLAHQNLWHFLLKENLIVGRQYQNIVPPGYVIPNVIVSTFFM